MTCTVPFRDIADKHLKLFLTPTVQHKPAAKDTIAKWIKNALAECGIVARLHSTHSMVVSTA
jgi:hypothetical protein